MSACPEEVTEDDLKKALERKTEYKKKTCLPITFLLQLQLVCTTGRNDKNNSKEKSETVLVKSMCHLVIYSGAKCKGLGTSCGEPSVNARRVSRALPRPRTRSVRSQIQNKPLTNCEQIRLMIVLQQLSVICSEEVLVCHF